ncbi:hypothetical protein N9D38_08500 [Rubripirellula sp.]|jgi:hypothetical protein|nr:hypothetical protein [Rubripirellula sp.]
MRFTTMRRGRIDASFSLTNTFIHHQDFRERCGNDCDDGMKKGFKVYAVLPFALRFRLIQKYAEAGGDQ